MKNGKAIENLVLTDQKIHVGMPLTNFRYDTGQEVHPLPVNQPADNNYYN